MSLRRAPLLLALAVLGAALFAPEASARPPCPFGGSLSSEHFTVHWQPGEGSGCGQGEVYFQPQAGETLALAEHAYRLFTEEWGYPAPVADGGLGGDDTIDIYVYDVSPLVGIFGTDGAGLGGTRSGWVALAPKEALEDYWVGTTVYYLSTLAIWGVFQDWFTFGSAEWAGLSAFGFPSFASMIEAPGIALDCYDTTCAESLFDYNGQARWPFFAYLADRYGRSVVRDVWQRVSVRGSLAPDGLGALTDVLAAKGMPLRDLFNDFTAAMTAGRVEAASIKGKAPVTVEPDLVPGAAVGATQTATVAVNHLSARFVKLVPGGSPGICHPATLRVDVTLPSGLGARPSFYAKEYGGLKAFTVAGTKATLTTPWDTCSWGDERAAIVGLPNPSTTENGKQFTVATTVTAVDTSTILSPDAPVAQTDPRPSIPTDAALPPPTLTFRGAPAVPVARDGSLTLAFFASSAGSLEVTAGGRRLKTARIRAGQNVVKLKLPLPKARKPAKRTKAGTQAALAARPARLHLTTLSPSGARGKTVSRRLRYAA